MRINTKFAVAVHLLTLLAVFADRGSLTSETMAKSVNTNPVVVRRINGMLKRAGLITVKAGVGGAALTKSPELISLADIYQAVKGKEDEMVFDVHTEPNQNCPIGANIRDALAEPLLDAQQALETSLRRYTLADMVKKMPR